MPALHGKFGVMRAGPGGTAVFYTDNNGDGTLDAGDATFTYGLSTDVALVGDWSGLGYESIGVVRGGADGVPQWILDSNGDNAYDAGDKVYSFGLENDAPLLGDWNDTGITQIGVARAMPNGTAQYSIDSNGDGTYDAGDKVYNFGLATDKFGAGDWNGDGKDTICVERPGPGGVAVFTLDNVGNGSFDPSHDRVMSFGYDSDIFIEGDWNGDGRTKLGVARPGPNGTLVLTLDTNGDGVYDAGDQVYTFGLASDTLLVGKWRTPAPLRAADVVSNSTVPARRRTRPSRRSSTCLSTCGRKPASAVPTWRRLRTLDYQVAALGGATLGLSSGHVITLDATADGNGWSLDSNGPAAGRMDLLSVVLHEQGHELGLTDQAGVSQVSDVMGDVLAAGVRRLPTPLDVQAILADPMHMQ